MEKTANEKIVDQLVDENGAMYDMYIPHKPVKLNTGTKTIVEQHHEETTNINKIIGRYRRSGVLPPQTQEPQYADVSEVPELLGARLQMADAMEAYANLPKSITDQFNNVGEFLQYVENQEQIIAQPVPEPEPEKTKDDSSESSPKEKPTPPAE